MLTSYTYFVSGASRSLGLGYVEKLLASSPSVKVVAGVRNPSNASQLDALASKPENKGRVLVVPFDVDSEQSVKAAAEKLKTDAFLEGGALDAVVVNAGVFVGGHKPPSEMKMDDVRANFRTNVEGAIFTVQYLLPLLERGKGKQIFFISSIVASFQEFYSQMAGGVSYSMSKAALNMYGVKLARELGPKGFTVLLVHPGYVKSDMNKFDNGGEISVEEAVTEATNNVFLPAKPEWNGRYIAYTGKDLPW
ncbi:hypothetical protein JCM10296v2_005391 [Rhodotorula toruloides]